MDTQKHVVLRDVSPLPEEGFFSKLNSRIDSSDEKQAFVFIHGYSVTFEDAARRTAQMAYDLGFDGAPIFFSWPSQGQKITPELRYFKPYTTDETNVKWSVPDLKEFLFKISSKTNARTIHLIAHSMGSEALTGALRKIANEQRETPVFKEIVLAAPDIDARIFKREIVPEIQGANRRITLYVSSEDEALKQSKEVHGGYSRAGDSGGEIVIVPGMDTIDASTVDTSFIGHSYYGDNRSVISDLQILLNQGIPPGKRNLLERWYDGAKYWIFRP
jgi:esterase/lipase superfamily enzyme